MSNEDFDKFPEDELAMELFERIAHKLHSRGFNFREYDMLDGPIELFMRVMNLVDLVGDTGFRYFFFLSYRSIEQTESAVKKVLGEPQLSIYNDAVKQFHSEIKDFKDHPGFSDWLAKSYKGMDFTHLNGLWFENRENAHSKVLEFIRNNKASFLNCV